jgi:hypothetical protein
MMGEPGQAGSIEVKDDSAAPRWWQWRGLRAGPY